MDADLLAPDLARANEILGQAKLPLEVTDFSVTPGHASSGEPALWVDLFVRQGELSDEALSGIVDFVQDTRDRMITSGMKAWPFLRITERPA